MAARTISSLLRLRKLCVPEGSRLAYGPAPIGFNTTMSSENVHAFLLDHLVDKLKPGSRALDIGTGSGFITACMALLTGPTGHVTTVDHVPDLLWHTYDVLQKEPFLNNSAALRLICTDARTPPPKAGLFDVIHFGGSVVTVPPKYFSLLNPDGILVAPVGRGYDQSLLLFEKRGSNAIHQTTLTEDFVFAPLTTLHHQLNEKFYANPFQFQK